MPATYHKLGYRSWQPSLDADDMTLREMLDSLPAAPANAIPAMVRLFENPNPPLRLNGLLPLPGAISLARHDALHVLLARGLLPQDEAFVIGFTMGSDPAMEERHLTLFRFVARFLYPKTYRLDKRDLLALELGVDCGIRNGRRDLRNFPFESHLDKTVGALRSMTGLTREFLRSYIAYEKLYLPDSSVSHRLDDLRETDTSHLYKPDGEDIGKLEA